MRIPLRPAVLVLAALFCVQQFQHTSLAFSLLFFIFMLVGNLAFNLAGGFSRITGAYVFFFTLLSCGVGVFAKAIIGEAADSNLKVPLLDMSVYCASNIFLLLLAVLIKKLFGHMRSVARIIESDALDYTLAGGGCLFMGIALFLINFFVPASSGSLLAILNQLNLFPVLAIILGTVGAIHDSNGRRSISLVSGLSLLFVSSFAYVSFSKQGMFTAPACWLLAALYARLRVRLVHVIVGLVVGVLSFTLIPLLATGRTRVPPEGASYGQRLDIALDITFNPGKAQASLQEAQEAIRLSQRNTGYFDKSVGLIERLTVIAVDDSFFNYTEQGNHIGYLPVILDLENYFPHFLLPDKPDTISGNYYAHQIGGYLSDQDDTTGISFSAPAEAYHIDGWVGVLLLLPTVWFFSLASADRLCGDVRQSPWGLLVFVGFAHSAAESLVGGLIYGILYGNVTLLVAMLFSVRVAPVLGALFAGNTTRQSTLKSERVQGLA